MPVSKKRKKDGKVVQRKDVAAAPHAEEHAAAPEARPAHGPQRAGRPSNPFVAQHQTKRGAQRGH